MTFIDTHATSQSVSRRDMRLREELTWNKSIQPGTNDDYGGGWMAGWMDGDDDDDMW